MAAIPKTATASATHTGRTPPRFASSEIIRTPRLTFPSEHDPEKSKPVFHRDKRETRLRGDHARIIDRIKRTRGGEGSARSLPAQGSCDPGSEAARNRFIQFYSLGLIWIKAEASAAPK
jgi:hypothetical protein